MKLYIRIVFCIMISIIFSGCVSSRRSDFLKKIDSPIGHTYDGLHLRLSPYYESLEDDTEPDFYLSCDFNWYQFINSNITISILKPAFIYQSGFINNDRLNGIATKKLNQVLYVGLFDDYFWYSYGEKKENIFSGDLYPGISYGLKYKYNEIFFNELGLAYFSKFIYENTDRFQYEYQVSNISLTSGIQLNQNYCLTFQYGYSYLVNQKNEANYTESQHLGVVKLYYTSKDYFFLSCLLNDPEDIQDWNEINFGISFYF